MPQENDAPSSSTEILQRSTHCIAQKAVSSFIGRLSNVCKSKNLSLKTLGKPMKIFLRPRQTINASGRCMLNIPKKIRSTFKRIPVDPYLSMPLVKLSNSFADLFVLKKTNLESKPHGLFDCCVSLCFVVFCTDIHQLITRACSGRSIDQSCAQINVGIDFGQSFLKISLTVFDADTQGDIFTSSKRRKTGGLKALTIALCQAQESFYNVEELIRLTKLSEFSPFTFSGDLKMINLVTGVAGFSSSFPCPFCCCHDKSCPTACLRTTGGNFDQFKLWPQTSSKLSEKRLFLNYSHAPVLHSPQPVLYFAPSPPLHLKLGLKNQLMTPLMKKCLNSC